jgi:hypothetical protein
MLNWELGPGRVFREDGLIVEYCDSFTVAISLNDQNMTLDEWLALYSEFKPLAAEDSTLGERLRRDLDHSERVGSSLIFTFEPTMSTETLFTIACRVDGLIALRTPKPEPPVDERKMLIERVAQLEAEVAELKQWMQQCRA